MIRRFATVIAAPEMYKAKPGKSDAAIAAWTRARIEAERSA